MKQINDNFSNLSFEANRQFDHYIIYSNYVNNWNSIAIVRL